MSSAQPDAIKAFEAIATAALPAGSQVWFGKTLPQYIAPVTLQITNTANGRQEPAELGPSYRREEEFDIVCKLSVWAGDQDFTQRLTDAFTNFGLITTAVANNPTLNGTVRFAQPREVNFTPDWSPDGQSVGELDFTLNCQVRITSLT